MHDFSNNNVYCKGVELERGCIKKQLKLKYRVKAIIIIFYIS